MPKLEKPVQLATIGAAHGIRGEVRVKSFTADPLALGDYGPLSSEDGRLFEVQAIRPAGEVVVVRFKGVADRNAAEALTGTALFVERAALPDDDEEDAFYHADLVGLAVKDMAGETIGRITAVQNFGGGDILDVALSARGSALVPFTKAAVPAVDVAGGFVTVDTVAAGLVGGQEEPEPGEDR
jgi:16S rRNA processing protein RimM